MRRIIQIAATPDTTDRYVTMYALCDDGTVWNIAWDMRGVPTKWSPVPPVPQDGDEEEGK